VWWRHPSGMHVDGPTQGLGSKGTRGERTRNMERMVVTLEVSQPEMSALKFFKPLKRELMSVMAETSQPAMGPHVAVAAVGLALNSWTAVCREALVVKTQRGEDGDGGGGGGGWLGLGGGRLSGLGGGGEGDGGGGLGDGGGGLGGGGEGDGGGGLGDGGGWLGNSGEVDGGGGERDGGGGLGDGGGGLGDGGL
jgi:hypothetical protein